MSSLLGGSSFQMKGVSPLYLYRMQWTATNKLDKLEVPGGDDTGTWAVI